MSSILRVAGAVLAVAVLSMAVACGGGSGAMSLEEYFDELQQLDDDFSQAQDELDEEYTDRLDVDEFSDEVGDDFQSYFASTRSAAADFVEELEGLDPPGEAEEAHNNAVDQFNDCLADTENVADDIGNAESFEQISEILNESTGSCEDTTESCNDLQSVADDNDIDVNLSCGD
jgi:hypothetical protein